MWRFTVGHARKAVAIPAKGGGAGVGQFGWVPDGCSGGVRDECAADRTGTGQAVPAGLVLPAGSVPGNATAVAAANERFGRAGGTFSGNVFAGCRSAAKKTDQRSYGSSYEAAVGSKSAGAAASSGTSVR